jgi:hypothetical protein
MFITVVSESNQHGVSFLYTLAVDRGTLAQMIELAGLVKRSPHIVCIPQIEGCVVRNYVPGLGIPEDRGLVTQDCPFGDGRATHGCSVTFYSHGALLKSEAYPSATVNYKDLFKAWTTAPE